MSRPPKDELVEVMLEGNPIKVRAIYGPSITKPYWESEDKENLYAINTFENWRLLDGTSA